MIHKKLILYLNSAQIFAEVEFGTFQQINGILHDIFQQDKTIYFCKMKFFRQDNIKYKKEQEYKLTQQII